MNDFYFNKKYNLDNYSVSGRVPFKDKVNYNASNCINISDISNKNIKSKSMIYDKINGDIDYDDNKFNQSSTNKGNIYTYIINSKPDIIDSRLDNNAYLNQMLNGIKEQMAQMSKMIQETDNKVAYYMSKNLKRKQCSGNESCLSSYSSRYNNLAKDVTMSPGDKKRSFSKGVLRQNKNNIDLGSDVSVGGNKGKKMKNVKRRNFGGEDSVNLGVNRTVAQILNVQKEKLKEAIQNLRQNNAMIETSLKEKENKLNEILNQFKNNNDSDIQ